MRDLRCLARPLYAAILLSGTALAAPITTSSLIGDMTDLAGMAEFPDPPYTCRQFSSYDRKSVKPGGDDWFANADYGQFLRVDETDGRKEHVMMDADGPGAIVRIWSANPKGTLRIYLDGAGQPSIEAPMERLLGGSFPGLPRPIAGEYSRGWNLYFPIPYAKHCKVTCDHGDFYYHVNYRTYGPGTEVKSFQAGDIGSLEKKIRAAAQRLTSPAANSPLAGQTTFDLEIPAGETLKREIKGPRAITDVRLRVEARDPDAALRGLVVKYTFDGETCVEAPLGDLFGSAPGINSFAALPLGMTRDGLLRSDWLMPFKETATLEFTNHTAGRISLTGACSVAEYRWTDRSMHFHAKWHSRCDVPTRPMIDWNYLTASGQGVFAGVSFSIDNPVKEWWGEGDEKIYVDGESFPSHFGTGTEDYYGYAWCWPKPFTHAYHSQSRCDGPGNYGRTSVNRFHILDRIPFQHDFKFDMELWHWNANCKVNLAVAAYWYARPGGSDTTPSITAADATVRPMAEFKIPRVEGAIEGEALKVLDVAGTVEPQEWDGTSAGKHLWWHAGMKPGDSLKLGFPSPKAGRYHVWGRFLSARDYGIHQLAVNGARAGEPIDFHHDGVKPTDEMDLGTFELKQGANELSVTVVGANPGATRDYMFGLDYLILKPAD